MNDVLALPEAEARKLAEARMYLDDKRLRKYEEAILSFYSPEPCYGVVDTALRLFLPRDCEAAKDLAIKRYLLLERDFNEGISERTNMMKNASDSIKSSLRDTIEALKRSKEHYRKEAIREYGVEIPV